MKKQLRKPATKYWRYVSLWGQEAAEGRQLLDTEEMTEKPPSRGEPTPPTNPKAKAQDYQAQRTGLNHPMDHTSSTRIMGEDAGDSVNEFKAGPQRAEIRQGLLQAGEPAWGTMGCELCSSQLKTETGHRIEVICNCNLFPDNTGERAPREQRTTERAAQEGRAGKTWDREGGAGICGRCTSTAGEETLTVNFLIPPLFSTYSQLCLSSHQQCPCSAVPNSNATCHSPGSARQLQTLSSMNWASEWRTVALPWDWTPLATSLLRALAWKLDFRGKGMQRFWKYF